MERDQGPRTSGAGPVVICCATSDRSAIETVVPELEKDGHLVEVVDGVEVYPAQLAEVIERCHGEGLYVLVRSGALSREVVDELRELLLGHHVPFGRTLTVASTRPRELLDRMRGALQRVASGRARKMSSVAPEGARKRRPTVLGMPVPTPSTPGATAEPQAQDPAEAAIDKRRRKPTQLGIPVHEVAAAMRAQADKEPASEPGTPVVAADDPDSFEEEAPTNVSARGGKSSSTDEVPAPPPYEPPPKTAPRSPTTRLDLSDGGVSFDELTTQPAPSERGSAPPRPPPPQPPAAPPEDPAPHPRPEDSLGSGELIKPEDLADLGQSSDSIPVVVGPSSTAELRRPLITGDTAVASLADLSRSGNTVRARALPSTDPPPSLPGSDHEPLDADPNEPAGGFPSDPAMATSSREGGSPPSGLDAPALGSAPARRIASPPWLGIGIAAAAVVLLIGVVLSWDDDEPTEVAQSDSSASTKTDEKPTSEPELEPEPEPEPIVGREPGGAPTRVMQALESRRVRALDILLVTAEAGGPMSFEDAKVYCSSLQLETLSGWRLPEVGELASLTDSGMLGRGYYWSRTAGDTFGDSHLSWWGRRRRVVSRDRDAYVVCVRGNRDAD